MKSGPFGDCFIVFSANKVNLLSFLNLLLQVVSVPAKMLNFELKILVMKIFGIGLNKPGIASLGKALEILGYSKLSKADLNLLEAWIPETSV